jgi:DUF4097 and DUF4098 domain-containing protein YvlB
MIRPGAYMMMRRSTLCGFAVLSLALLAAAACGHLPLVEAHDEWKRSYPLSQGGTLEIRNTNGEIKVEPGEGSTVEVVARRTARASTLESANNALKSIEIRETASPTRIVLDSAGGMADFSFAVSREVEYSVRLPKWANVVLKTTNGEILAAGLTGSTRLETTNGEIQALSLEGPVRADTTNGDVRLEISKLADDGIDCSTTNGEIVLTLPASAKASLTAETNNGGIDTSGLDLKVTSKDRNDLRATIGGGGPLIKLDTTNGAIRVRGR